MYDKSRNAAEASPGARGKCGNLASADILTVLLVDTPLPDDMMGGPTATVHVITAGQLDGDCLARTRPDVVLSPLVGNGFDCFDIAECLTAAGFAGRYRAVVATLPNPAIVRRELRAQFPGLDFDLIMLS